MFYNKRIILIYARFLYKSFSISFDITMCECIFACLSFSLCVYVRRSKSTSHRSLFYYIINFFPIQFLWAFIRSMFDFPLLRLYRKLNVLINVCVCVYMGMIFLFDCVFGYVNVYVQACSNECSSSFLAVFNFIWNCSNRQKNVSAICDFKITRHSLEIQHRATAQNYVIEMVKWNEQQKPFQSIKIINFLQMDGLLRPTVRNDDEYCSLFIVSTVCWFN